MTEMENLEKRFDELSKHIPEYESDVWKAIDSLEQASLFAVDKGKEKLEVAISRLNEIDDLISTALSMFPLSEKANMRLTQCLVSVRPRMNSYIEQLKNLIDKPPEEPKYPKIDDVEIFERLENEEEMSNDTNNEEVGSSNENNCCNNIKGIDNDNINDNSNEINDDTTVNNDDSNEVLASDQNVTTKESGVPEIDTRNDDEHI